MDEADEARGDEPLLRVMALHALGYCERLFYLEEVEELRVADAAVFAGRTLHVEIARDEDEGDVERLTVESAALGLRGQMDALRRRDGQWLPYEHKRGRSMRDLTKKPCAWPSDLLQIAAYAMLLEESVGAPVTEGRLRYHADGVTVRVPIDEAARAMVRAAVERARVLRGETLRPPVTTESGRCLRCSLAPLCLPEEERLAKNPEWEPVRLTPAEDDRQTVHIVGYKARLGRKGDEIECVQDDGTKTALPVKEIGHVVIHGGAQASTQALHLCVENDVTVSWITGGGRYVGTLATGGFAVQRRVRQYRALDDEGRRLALARSLVAAKVENGLRFVLRASRGEGDRSETLSGHIDALRAAVRRAHAAESVDSLLGCEGEAATHYFASWNELLVDTVDPRLRYVGRSRRPPKDRVSALLGFGYALLLKDVGAAIVAVGLEPALGFYHRPRSAAPPLALDLMELFRGLLVDMPVVAAVNRGQWDPEADFAVSGERVWLSESGRRKLIDVYERRKAEQWKHPVVGYSLSYARMIELEARLLEKEWTGAPGLFAQFRIR
jgi:CRISPR-associated protein Cas1